MEFQLTQLDDDKSRRPPAISIAAVVAAPLLLLAGLWFVLTGDGGHAEPGAPAPSTAASATTFSADQKLAIEGIVKDYLMKNPEILLEVQTALEAKAAEQDAAKTKALVAEHAKDIYRSPNSPVAEIPTATSPSSSSSTTTAATAAAASAKSRSWSSPTRPFAWCSPNSQFLATTRFTRPGRAGSPQAGQILGGA